MKRILLFFALLSMAAGLSAAPKAFTLKSPDGRMKVEISTDGGIRYSLTHDDVLLLENSGLSMSLTDGTVYGGPESKLRRARIGSANRTVKAVAYKKAEVRENYNELTLEYRGFKVIFRAYDDACAYRFVSLSDKPFIVKDDVVKVDTPKAENEKADKKSGKKQSGKGADAAKSDKTASVTKIDVEGLADRIVKLPLRSGNYGNFYCDGKKLWLINGGETMVFTFDTRKCESFGRGQLTVSANGKKASFKSGNKVYVMDFPASKLSTEKILDLSNVKATIDYPEEWAQIFDEAWRAYRDGFYLENMHGVDWNAMKEKYAALLPFVKCRQDLSYVIGGLVGELA